MTLNKKDQNVPALMEESKDEIRFEIPTKLGNYGDTQDIAVHLEGVEIVDTQKTMSIPTLQKEIPSEGDITIDIK